jgi:nuclear transport factor 2 (NTF2) superfamily protein
MKCVADGWNEGNAEKAAGCFAEDAIYLDPPDKQIYRSRKELFEFFGGKEGRKRPMKMVWHHLAFNESTGIGSGEFTFEYSGISHGVVIVRIKNGKIQNWREYYYETPLNWEEFTRHNPF